MSRGTEMVKQILLHARTTSAKSRLQLFHLEQIDPLSDQHIVSYIYDTLRDRSNIQRYSRTMINNKDLSSNCAVKRRSLIKVYTNFTAFITTVLRPTNFLKGYFLALTKWLLSLLALRNEIMGFGVKTFSFFVHIMQVHVLNGNLIQ